MPEQTRAPTSDENVTGTWTGSAGSRWTVVDDHPDAGGTDSLTHGTTAGVLTFGFSAFTVPSDATITSVSVDYYDIKSASQACTFGGRLKVGASYFNAATHNPAQTRTLRTDTWATNPATSAAWTVAQVNGTAGSNNLAAFGYNSGSDASPTILTSSIQLRVTYTVPTAVTGALSGVSASVGTLVAVLGSLAALSGASTSTGTIAGTVAVLGSLAGASTSAGTLSGTVEADTGVAVEGALSGSSTSAGTLAALTGSTGALSGVSASAGSLVAATGALASLSGASTSAGTCAGVVGIVGVCSGASTSAGSLAGEVVVDDSPDEPDPPAAATVTSMRIGVGLGF